MASQARTVELWDKLQPDGGVRKAVFGDWSRLVETNREDGNDSLVLAFPLSDAAALLVTNGYAVRIVGEDAVIREYLIYVIEDDVASDTVTLTCAGARARLNTPTVADGTTTGTASACLSAAGTGAGIAWVTLTTSVSVGTISVTFSGDTVLSAMEKVCAAVDATLADGDPPCVFSFVMTSASVYTLTLRTTVTAGTAHLLQGKNIARITRRRDTTDPTWPTTGYNLLVADLYRDTPTTYANDNLKPYETCRLEWPSLSINVTIRIVSVITDHRNSIGTTVELGTPKRRAAQTVVDQTTAIDAPQPTISITETVAATTYAYTFAAIGYVTVNIDGAGANPVTSPISGIARNAFGGARKEYLFAVASGGRTLYDVRYVEPQDPTIPTSLGPTLTVTATPSTTTYSIAYAGDSVQVSIDGAAYGSPATATPLVVSRNAVGGADQAYTFKATKDSQVITAPVIVMAQVAAAPPAGLLTKFSIIPTGSGYLTTAWEMGYMPSGGYFKIYTRCPDATDAAGQNWNAYSGNNISSGTRTVNLTIATERAANGWQATAVTECNFSAPNAAPFWVLARLEVYDGSNVVQATAEFSCAYWATPT